MAKTTVKCDKCKKQVEKSEALKIEIIPKKKPKNPEEYKPQYKYRHKECHEKAEKERLEFNELYDYLKYEYFLKVVPPFLIQKIRDFREFYTFKEMLKCLKYLEFEIKKVNTKDNQHLSNTIMYFLKNNIEDYQKNQVQKEIQQADFEHFRFIDYSKYKKNNEETENYDILD